MFNFFKKDKPEEPDLWKSFRGRRNSNDVLAEKAKLLAAVIVEWMRDASLAYLEKKEKYKNQKDTFVNIFLSRLLFMFTLQIVSLFNFWKLLGAISSWTH